MSTTTTLGAETEESAARPGEAQAVCANCGVALAGDYCHGCGEKRPDARDISVKHFVAEAAGELTSVEHSKLWRTLGALLFKPGLLTAEYFSGRRSRYLKPLNLCLAVFALHLFVYTAYQRVSTFNIKQVVETQKHMAEQWKMPNADALPKVLDKVAARKGVPVEMLYESINEKWNRNASLVQIPQIVLMALMLQFVYLFRRYFVEHLVFSLHFLSFTALTVVMMWPIYFVMGIKPTFWSLVIVLLKFLIDIVYLFVAARVFYKESVGKALLRAPVIFVGYFVIYVILHNVAMLAALSSATR